MTSLETVALKIAREQADTPDEAEEAFDPASIFAIIQFIQDLIAQCQQRSRRRRFNARRALRAARDPGLFAIGRAVRTAQRHGFEGREAHGLVKASIVVFRTVAKQDVEEWVVLSRNAMVL